MSHYGRYCGYINRSWLNDAWHVEKQVIFTLLTLCEDEDDYVDASAVELSRSCGFRDPRTTRGGLKTLEEAGLIRSQKRGPNEPMRWWLNFEALLRLERSENFGRGLVRRPRGELHLEPIVLPDKIVAPPRRGSRVSRTRRASNALPESIKCPTGGASNALPQGIKCTTGSEGGASNALGESIKCTSGGASNALSRAHNARAPLSLVLTLSRPFKQKQEQKQRGREQVSFMSSSEPTGWEDDVIDWDEPLRTAKPLRPAKPSSEPKPEYEEDLAYFANVTPSAKLTPTPVEEGWFESNGFEEDEPFEDDEHFEDDESVFAAFSERVLTPNSLPNKEVSALKPAGVGGANISTLSKAENAPNAANSLPNKEVFALKPASVGGANVSTLSKAENAANAANSSPNKDVSSLKPASAGRRPVRLRRTRLNVESSKPLNFQKRAKRYRLVTALAPQSAPVAPSNAQAFVEPLATAPAPQSASVAPLNAQTLVVETLATALAPQSAPVAASNAQALAEPLATTPAPQSAPQSGRWSEQAFARPMPSPQTFERPPAPPAPPEVEPKPEAPAPSLVAGLETREVNGEVRLTYRALQQLLAPNSRKWNIYNWDTPGLCRVVASIAETYSLAEIEAGLKDEGFKTLMTLSGFLSLLQRLRRHQESQRRREEDKPRESPRAHRRKDSAAGWNDRVAAFEEQRRRERAERQAKGIPEPEEESILDALMRMRGVA